MWLWRLVVWFWFDVDVMFGKHVSHHRVGNLHRNRYIVEAKEDFINKRTKDR